MRVFSSSSARFARICNVLTSASNAATDKPPLPLSSTSTYASLLILSTYELVKSIPAYLLDLFSSDGYSSPDEIMEVG